ncbi:MAG TPA: multiheme c-type cytochrome [Urbifossiella sp.]|nr:multiheme c-type cytochrome [Urbifossiella sp.]
MTAPAPRGPTRWIGVVLGAFAAAVGLFLWAPWQKKPDIDSNASPDDPRLTFATPYLNVRPEVRYVGDSRCGECHAQAATYPHHPMARSSATAGSVADRMRYDAAAGNPFEKDGLLYSVERRGSNASHSVARRAASGQELASVAHEPTYAIGSGTHGRAFLVERDGFLYQSPITWFPEANRWDLSPGYTATTLFDRPIKPACLFCHASDARPIAHMVNRYQAPAIRGHGIGCERCHGPAELHLTARDTGKPERLPDYTIVNPARLEPPLRDAVCEQCHLQGEARILRRGREPFDFRPGLPLHLFWSVFVRPPELADDFKFVGHSEQMRASACAAKSEGRLGCISCHDPHQLPEPAQRLDYYRGRCQSCHEKQPCVRPIPKAGGPEFAHHKANDCIACHMPRRANAEITHTTVIDHRVPRRPGATASRLQPKPDQFPLELFHKNLDGGTGPEADRDLGLAMIETAQRQSLPPAARVAVGKLAQPFLDGAIARAADDLAALEARGHALAMQGQGPPALADFQAALKKAPRRESTLAAAAEMAAALKQYPLAEEYFRRQIGVNPWGSRSHARLAEILAQRNAWPETVKECREALRLNPTRDVRRSLIIGLLRTGDRRGAESEFEKLLRERPAEAASLKNWWTLQSGR